MATTAVQGCSFCFEGFDELKILPCPHLLCRKCLLSLLQSSYDVICPECMAPLDRVRSHGNFEMQVDYLPTDLATARLADCQKTLTGPHVCSCSKAASSFCMQCNIKLCTACAERHMEKRSKSKTTHVLETLSDLTVEYLATHSQTFCSTHFDLPLDQFCTQHEEVVCDRCVNVHHVTCLFSDKVKDIRDVASVERENLRKLAQTLGNKEAAYSEKSKIVFTKMSKKHAEYKTMRSIVREAGTVKQNAEIQALMDIWFDKTRSIKEDVQQLLTNVATHKNLLEQLASGSTDVVVLGMVKSLKEYIRREVWISFFGYRRVCKKGLQVELTVRKLNGILGSLKVRDLEISEMERSEFAGIYDLD